MAEDTQGSRRRPLKPGLFTVPEDRSESPYLVGSRCPQCGTHFFPRRAICLSCGHRSLEDAPLKGRGTLYTYTIAHQQLPGALVQVPYAVAIVSLEEGCQVYTVVTEDFESLEIGMEMEVYFDKVKEDEEGNELLAYKFRPVKVSKGQGQSKKEGSAP